MSTVARARRPRAPPFLDPPGYARHRPEATLLYQLVEQHYPPFRQLRAEAGRPLPDYVEQEFEAYLKCGRLEEGFLLRRAELTRTTGHTGAVTLVQRFGSALNLNIHFQLQGLVEQITSRVGQVLERRGLIERDLVRRDAAL